MCHVQCSSNGLRVLYKSVQTILIVDQLFFDNESLTMKLKLDDIQAKYLPLNMQGQAVQQPVLKIVAGDFEATTST